MPDAADMLSMETDWVRILGLVLARFHFGVVGAGDGFNGQCDEVGGQDLDSDGPIWGPRYVAMNE